MITVKEIAERLNLTVWTIQKRLKARNVNPVEKNRNVFLYDDSAVELLENRKRQPKGELNEERLEQLKKENLFTIANVAEKFDVECSRIVNLIKRNDIGESVLRFGRRVFTEKQVEKIGELLIRKRTRSRTVGDVLKEIEDTNLYSTIRLSSILGVEIKELRKIISFFEIKTVKKVLGNNLYDFETVKKAVNEYKGTVEKKKEIKKEESAKKAKENYRRKNRAKSIKRNGYFKVSVLDKKHWIVKAVCLTRKESFLIADELNQIGIKTRAREHSYGVTKK